jgi:hypothetical protein
MNASEPTTAPGQDVATSIKDITQASRQMFEAGERMTANLEALEQKVEYATDWQSRLAERPWLIVGGAILSGFILWRIFRD